MNSTKSYIKFLNTAIFLLCTSINLYAQKPIWVNQLTGTGDCDVHVCKIAPNGSIYIAGSFSGVVDIDPGSSINNIYSKGGKDIFLACYTASGSLIWSVSMGGAGNDLAENLAVDKNNDPVLVGQISGQNIDFDPSPLYKYLHANGPADGFVAKYTSNGAYVWGTNLGGYSVHDNTLAVSTDADANIYVGGDFHEDMDIDPAPLGKKFLHSLSGTAYLIKYTAGGQIVWGFNFGAGSIAGIDNAVWAIDASDKGHVYITGGFAGSNIDFNPAALAVNNLSSAGIYDVFIAKYTDAGVYEFAKAISGTKVEQPFDIALDANKDVYITGYTESPDLNLDNTIITSPNANGKSDIFLAKYSSTGQYKWAHIFGGTGTDVGWGVAIYKDKLYCTGYFKDTMDADPTQATDVLYGKGDNEIYLSKYELNGDFICSFSIGGKSTDVGRKIAFDKAGNLLMSGLFAGAGVDFDPFATNYLVSAPDIDGFFALYDWNNVYTPPAGYLIGDTICSGRTAYFTFIATAGNGPFTITYSDGTATYVQSNLVSGMRFPLIVSPGKTTVYKLTSIKGSGLCAPTSVPNTPVTILVYPSPHADAGADTSVCPGALIQLHGSGEGDYEWYPATGISNVFIPNPLLVITDSTVRHIIVSNNYGCKDTNAITILIRQLDVKTDPRRDVCIGDTIRLSASGGDIYTWQPGSDIDFPNSSSPRIWPRADRVYTVRINDTVCSRAAEIQVAVAVHELPDIRIVKAKDADCGLKTAELAATGGVAYKWSPENTLNDANIATPVANPAENTLYVVIGKDHNGCVNRDSAEIKVFVGNGRLYAPDAFTPNNDGKNDCYHVMIPGDLSDFEFSIFNRFGQRVFHTTSYSGCWDGRVNGVDQPLGTYYYFYKAHSSICDKVFGKGDVQLIR